MRDLLDSEEFEFRYDIGVAQPSLSLQLTDRDRILRLLMNHFAVVNVKAQLDQIVDGLKTLSVLNLIQSNPRKMLPLFLHADPAQLTVDMIIDMFSPVLSPMGSNQREMEGAVEMQWVGYLQKIEGKHLIFLMDGCNIGVMLRAGHGKD